ncbi:MAG: SDR family oxidoreductase [Kiritimatiellae bacterium]|nr:SDR family oxidoreductase [Kiritimatiellia bacterium]
MNPDERECVALCDVRDQVALVTGAGRGIGRSIGRMLGRGGAHVVLAARTRQQIEAVAAEIAAAGGRATAVPADVAREEEVDALFSAIREQHGRIDILINNAGIGLFGRVAEIHAADFDRVLQVNLRGTFLCCRQAMRMMIPRRRGTIINVASVVGVNGYPSQGAYTASKHGVMGLTKTLAVEAQEHGIRVSAVLPGGVDTELVGRARPDLDRGALMQPDDIAQAVAYLLSLSDRAAVDQILIRRRMSAPF